MLGLDTPSASANSPSVSGPREFSDPSAATTETECSPSVSRLRRRTIRMRATRRLPATSAGVPMVAENWLGILISLHNQYEAGRLGSLWLEFCDGKSATGSAGFPPGRQAVGGQKLIRPGRTDFRRPTGSGSGLGEDAARTRRKSSCLVAQHRPQVLSRARPARLAA